MPEDKPEPPVRSATSPVPTTRSPDPPPSAAVRHRLPQRHSSTQNVSLSPVPTLDRRRSSMLSYSSIDEMASSITEDLINPSVSRPKSTKENDEVTHWHSTPLAFAILPAVAGVLFKNGSAFVTDILLLTLAAIFMNWSIRLPWDWYYSAQSQRRDVEPDFDIIEEEIDADETAVESASSAGESPKQSPQREPQSSPIERKREQRRHEAAVELRKQELWALLSTFALPAFAAYLLHVIRAQLSSSSTGLVSDYNLSIFLLAAEIRPFRQLIRLVTNRTLHLQRTVISLNDPFGAAVEEKSLIDSLTSRIADLETKLSEHTVLPQNIAIAQKTDVSELSTEMKKRFEPRLEGLERAMRRYEKRSTTLTMLTDQRLGSLETRLQDALSLAAVAAQQSQNRGALATLFESISALIAWPLNLAWSLAVWPLRVVDDLYVKVKTILLGPAPARHRKRSTSRHGVAKEEKVKEKAALRKVNR